MTPELRVRMLGEFSLTHGGLNVSAVNSPRLQALLAYLILHRRAPQPRRHLAFLFWPDSTETQSRTNLRHLLHELQHALPDAERVLLTDEQRRKYAALLLSAFRTGDISRAERG